MKTMEELINEANEEQLKKVSIINEAFDSRKGVKVKWTTIKERIALWGDLAAFEYRGRIIREVLTS